MNKKKSQNKKMTFEKKGKKAFSMFFDFKKTTSSEKSKQIEKSRLLELNR